jgi:hypothetical protein
MRVGPRCEGEGGGASFDGFHAHLHRTVCPCPGTFEQGQSRMVEVCGRLDCNHDLGGTHLGGGREGGRGGGGEGEVGMSG